MDMEGILAITFIFGGGTLFLLSISPVGKAIAERIRLHGAVPTQDPELLAEVDAAPARSLGAARAGGLHRAHPAAEPGARPGRKGGES